jgi:XTP/dITP diphosphohydrolase
MKAVMSIVVATGNRAKLAEFRSLLADQPVEVLCSAEALGSEPNIAEDGDTFEENALKKARAVAQQTMMVTIADDSGLEVEALGGRPGVRSRRFASEGATDAENNAELLRRMDEVDDDARAARFRAAIALVDPWAPRTEVVVEGRCDGTIARKPTGTGGFGYDPLFIVTSLGRTMAELSEDEKNGVSHRGKALRALLPRIEAIVGKRLEDARSIVEGTWAPPPSSSFVAPGSRR